MKNNNLENDKLIWDENAEFWDHCMGDESNEFHRKVVRPKVNELLHPKAGDFILDVACGNGNYSAYMAEKGAHVVACDYSDKMIELAKVRQERYKDKIDFFTIDATDEMQLKTLKKDRKYNKITSLMAIMDISNIVPLFQTIHEFLEDDGIFVFATQHPCFVTLTDKYLSSHYYLGEAIQGQPQLQTYYHRSLQEIFNVCFENDFIIDGFFEESYNQNENPDVIIVRARKRRKG